MSGNVRILTKRAIGWKGPFLFNFLSGKLTVNMCVVISYVFSHALKYLVNLVHSS